MGQSTPQGAPVSADAGAGPPAGDGLAARRQAVAAAREQLGRDIDRLIDDTRTQMESTVEKLAWRLAAGVAGAGAALLVTKALTAGWKAVRGTDPPANPASRRTDLTQAMVWTALTGAAAAAAKVAATRGAAAGWEKATGQVPPGVED